jgi:uncharacterized protein YidB (DUF937 family)
MGLFDELKGAVFQAAEGEAQNLIGGAVESAVPGGLDGLIGKLQAGGLGEQVSSWLGEGSNLPISPDQLQSVLGDEHVQQIADHLGLPVDQILQGLTEHLPGLVAQKASD